MPTLQEALDAPISTPIHDALVAGVDVLGQDQTVEFTPYVRTVLPVDGFVFWMRADLLTPVEMSTHGLQSALPVTVAGSLHYATIGNQVEDEVIAIRRVDFTSETQITAFAEIAPDVMYVAEWATPLGSFRFTFSQRSTYYQQADLHHYVGDAIYPAFARQLIDDASGFDQRQVASNSLPLWLAMMRTVPYVSLITSGVQLYPAYMLPPNLVPPYGAIEITPTSTQAIASAAWRGSDSTRLQLVTERVRLIFYGLRNDEVMDFLDYAIDYAANTSNIGIMNAPVPRDEYRPQVELAALAQKKIVEFEVCYYQQRCREIARQLIRLAITPTFYPSDDPLSEADLYLYERETLQS